MEGKNTNIAVNYFSWWYSHACPSLLAYLKKLLIYLTDLFSVKICLKTLFYPWRRDSISYEGLSLQQKFQIWLLNSTSRLIGAIIKLFTIITYLVVLSFYSLLSLFFILFWYLYPLIIVLLVVRAVLLLIS